MNIQKLDKEVEIINKQLLDQYGIDTVSSNPMFRIVWNTDQMEKVHGTFVDYSGNIYVRTVTETRIVHKYRGFQLDRYVLERLVLVPESQQDQLLGLKVSYEGLYTFTSNTGEFLPPIYKAAKFIIDTVLAAQSTYKKMIDPHDKTDRVSMRKWMDQDPEYSQEASIEYRKNLAKEIENEIFGNQSGLMGTTLPGGNAIIVPHNYEKNKS